MKKHIKGIEDTIPNLINELTLDEYQKINKICLYKNI